MTSEVYYAGDLRTKARHLRSGREILTDAPVDNNGKGEAFSPTDLVATALASCMLTVMGIKARDNGWTIDGSSAEIHKTMAAQPRRISAVRIELRMQHDELPADARALLEQTALNCPVAKSVHPDILQQVEFKW